MSKTNQWLLYGGAGLAAALVATSILNARFPPPVLEYGGVDKGHAIATAIIDNTVGAVVGYFTGGFF